MCLSILEQFERLGGIKKEKRVLAEKRIFWGKNGKFKKFATLCLKRLEAFSNQLPLSLGLIYMTVFKGHFYLRFWKFGEFQHLETKFNLIA